MKALASILLGVIFLPAVHAQLQRVEFTLKSYWTHELQRPVHDVEVVDRMAYVIAAYSSLQLIDVSDPVNPVHLGGHFLNGFAWDIEVVGDLVYIAAGYGGLQVVDVSDPAAPSTRGSLYLRNAAVNLEVAGDLAYVVTGDTGLDVIDISDPSRPVRLGNLQTSYPLIDVKVKDHMAYVIAEELGFFLVDVSNPARPSLHNGFRAQGNVMELEGDLAILPSGSSGLMLLDLSDPARPRSRGIINTVTPALDLEIAGNLVFLADGSGLRVFDISDWDNPVAVGRHISSGHASHVAVVGKDVYVGDGDSGLGILRFDRNEPPELVLEIEPLSRMTITGNPVFIAPDDEGVVIHFDASGSTDPNGDALAFEWLTDAGMVPLDPDALPALIGTPSSNRFTDNTAQNGTTYYYDVAAVNRIGESLNTAQASAMPAPTVASEDGGGGRGGGGPPVQNLLKPTRGPYLQQGTPTSMIIRWKTVAPTASVVRYGPSPDNLTGEASVPVAGNVTDHTVKITGLEPNTDYFYAVNTSIGLYADEDCFFHTSPPTGAPHPTRIWAIGDSGTADHNAAAVRNAFLETMGAHTADLWLMLGDNAYPIGTDEQYQAAVFDMYPSILKNTVLWPCIGNHDTYVGGALPYFDIFTLPTGGEAGGMASGTEQYFSFDYANIHFIVLDSMNADLEPSGSMAMWLRSDVDATTADWIIAFWHHPVYSRGSHNSDFEFRLVKMRETFLPILEEAGVDLVLNGHSHSYERSHLLNGHYDRSDTLDPFTMILDNGGGQEDGGGAYEKSSSGRGTHDGAVYITAGCSGSIRGGSLDHPAMFVSLNRLGSVLIDINGNRMDVQFLREVTDPPQVDDYFTLIKGPTGPPPIPTGLVAMGEDNRVELSWETSPGAMSYNVRRSTVRNDHHSFRAGPGEHDVTVVVHDGQVVRKVTAVFDVITLDEAVQILMLQVADSHLPERRKHPLLATLNAAMASFDRGRMNAGCNQLGVFRHKVKAQVMRLDPELGEALIQSCQDIIDAVARVKANSP